MTSGYCNCTCRDCFEIAIGDSSEKAPVCHSCQSAGCADQATFPDCECLGDTAYDREEVQS